MKNSIKVFFLFLLVIVIYSCEKEKKQDISKFIELRDQIKNEYAPDKRVALFNIEISSVDGEFF